MKKINIRCENGQLKKWFKWTIVGLCCATIFGVTIGGICISGLHPWSEIVSSSLYTSGLKDNTLTIMTNQTPQTNLASENIKIQIKNHNGAKNITLLDQYYFAPYSGDPEEYQPAPVGTAQWEIHTDPNFSIMEQYFYIDPTEDWLNCRTIPNDVGTKHNSFDLYIETNITFYDNSAYNFGNLKLVSDPIKVKISSNT